MLPSGTMKQIPRPKRNAALFRKVADWIQKHPERYDQTTWGRSHESCGTHHCIAGATALLCGAKPWMIPFSSGKLVPTWEKVVYRGKEVWCDSFAELRLGLTLDERRILFHPDWRPRRGIKGRTPTIRVAKALREFARGAKIR